MKYRRIKINEDYWNYRVLSTEKYTELYGPDSAAITDMETKTIDIAENGLNLDTIIHEIFHAYKNYLCIDSAEMTNDAIEEIYASFFAKNSFKILEKASIMYEKLMPIVDKDKMKIKEFTKLLKKMDEWLQKPLIQQQ